jgi:hypothetical protein
MQLPIHSQPLANRVAGFMAEAAKISSLRADATQPAVAKPGPMRELARHDWV